MRPRTPTSSPVREQQSKKRAIKRKRKIAKVIAVAAVIITVLILLFRLPIFRIKTIEVSGNQLVQTDQLVDAAWQQLLGNYALIIPNNNIFFMRKGFLHDVLLEAFPRIATLDVQRGNLRTLELEVKERPHAFVWCQDPTMSNCYFADDDGLLFAKAPYFSESVFLTFFGGDISEGATIDSYILNDHEEFHRLILQIHTLEDADFSITKIHIGARREYIFDVSHIGQMRTPNAKIFVTTKIEPKTSVYNLGLAMNTDDFKTSFAQNASALQYIDARLSEKIFYKFGSPAKPVTTIAQ